MHDIYDSEKHCRRMLPRSSLVLYHPLQVGDRVIQGPDWQWGTQGCGEEGTITLLKRWKDTDGLAVGILSALHDRLGVLWDDGYKNVYRYGAENAYDVIESLLFLLFPVDRIPPCDRTSLSPEDTKTRRHSGL